MGLEFEQYAYSFQGKSSGFGDGLYSRIFYERICGIFAWS